MEVRWAIRPTPLQSTVEGEMRTLVTKQHILEGAGYVYNFDREIYFNRKTKKVFSMI